MYNVFKTVIENTPFALTDMIKKINTNWVQSYLTDEQREELLALAQEKSEPSNDLGTIQSQIDEIWVAVHALQSADAPAEEEEKEAEEFPEYVKPESKDQYYSKGDKCTYKGKQYIYVGDKASAYDPISYPYAVNKDGTVRGWMLYETYLAQTEE